MSHSCHARPPPVQTASIKPKRKTRKRKQPKVDYYGYDPSILVFEGDPRLSPPPDWFGVNYHPSQPISNSWLEWSGADVAMFDISTNRAIPITEECSLVRDSQKRRKQKTGSSPSNSAAGNENSPSSSDSFSRVEKPSHLTLHPFQPTRNEWSDWQMEMEMKTDKSPKVAIGVPSVLNKKKIKKVSVPVNTYAPMEVEVATNRNIPKQSTVKPPKYRSTEEGPIAKALKEEPNEEKEIVFDKHNKNLSKLYRMRKFMYIQTIEEHVGHLEELKRVLTSGRGMSQNSLSTRDRAILQLVLSGDSTYSGIKSHEFCSHSSGDTKETVLFDPANKRDDGFEPEVIQKQLAIEIKKKMHVRRIKVFLDQDKQTRRDVCNRVLDQIENSVLDLERLATAQLVISSITLKQQQLQTSLYRTLGLTQQQTQQLQQPDIFKNAVREKIKFIAIIRILRTARRLLFVPQVEKTNEVPKSILNKKQLEKLLTRVASRQVFVDSSDPLEDLLAQMEELSLLK